MKKSFLLSAILLLAFYVQAQNYDALKTLVTLTQYKKAKEDLDKSWSNAKFVSKPEAYILKATIYAALAADPATKGTATGDQLVNEADATFTKYREMDPSMALINDPIYQNGPINIYSVLYAAGAKDYDTKNWQSGFQKFKKVVEYADLLITKKVITNIAADTASILFAAITADNAGLKDEAVKYYSRLADLKASGKDYEGGYQFLMRYYALKKDDANFEKYKALGKELYPNSEYFTFDKVDFAAGLANDFNNKVAALEEVVAKDPANYKANIILGEIIYDTLNSRKEGAVQPANATELEAKMIKALYKAYEAKPDDEIPLIYVGDHFINKAVVVNDEREAHINDMKKRTKPGTAASKDDIAKRDALDAKYVSTLESARDPYEKAAAVLAKKEKLTGQQKQQYKKIAGYLGDIYQNKVIKAKGNAADIAKYTAEKKKWDDVYESIK